ncbi:hypothetical protein [Vagococcus sp.]|uniref:hypothetical protein n=1 Tax=Vagococcus sp. TaxID=1933889 RepID=UPI003F9E0179
MKQIKNFYGMEADVEVTVNQFLSEISKNNDEVIDIKSLIDTRASQYGDLKILTTVTYSV